METLSTILNKICEPYPHVMPDELQRKIQAQRNKSMLVMMCSLLLLISLCFPFYMRGPTKAEMIFMAGAFLNIIALCLTCRTHPALYKSFYALTITFNGPLASFYNDETVYGCWTGVHIYPVLLLYFIESKALYIFQMVFQIFCLHFIYKPRMVDALFNATSVDFVSKLADGATFSSIFFLIAMYLIGLHMQNSHKYELLIAEHKRGELERQKTFLLSFSHELRNLIHAIVGNIQLSLLEKLPPIVRYHIENAESGASVLLQFINNILDTGKIDVEDLEINPTPVILHDTLEKMWNICSYLLRAKELKGQLQISKNIPKVVKIDQYRLMQILLNLILNAVKYTQKGSIHVKLEWIEGESEVQEKVFMPYPFDDENEGLFEKNQAMSILSEELMSLSVDAKKWSSQEYNTPQGKDKGLLKITVSDTGCGIHPGNISKIFERNFNGAPTLGSRKLGTTLGLFITKTLCHRMGGNIKAFSKVNKGASFICCLPAEPILTESAVDVDAKCLVDFVKEWKMRVMIVDDLNFNVTVLKNYFQKIELGVAEVAKTGLEAFKKYVDSVNQGKKLDIITMDVEMPVMSGKESAQKIREFEIENGLEPCLLIMVSGNCSESEISECLDIKGKIRADYFLKKPVTYDDFFSTLAKYYGKRYED